MNLSYLYFLRVLLLTANGRSLEFNPSVTELTAKAMQFPYLQLRKYCKI